MISKKSDDAISPVIGVMLMLVVTVVIAAAVTIFATGVVGETEPAPVAALDVKIYDYYQALDNAGGPDFHITHLSGEPVETKDIELRFSCTHKDGSGKDCSHYSTYSAKGCNENIKDGIKIETDPANPRKQALYVKTFVTQTMRDESEFDSMGLNYYFGDAILTPGVKLTATAEFLPSGKKNTQSIFMDVIFNNYVTHEGGGGGGVTHMPVPNVHEGEQYTYNPDCPQCQLTQEYFSDSYWEECPGMYAVTPSYDWCGICDHAISECTGDNTSCGCYIGAGSTSTATAVNIMDHLPAGTPVDVMIVHMPSGKAIYDKTVIVE